MSPTRHVLLAIAISHKTFIDRILNASTTYVNFIFHMHHSTLRIALIVCEL